MISDADAGRATAYAFESFGVRMRVRCDRPEVARRLPAVLPPVLTPIPLDAEAEEFALVEDRAGAFTFLRGGSPVSRDVDLEFGLTMLETQVRLFIAAGAPERIFVHAGAVAFGERAVIFPGRSFSGKTTLVASFLRAGATYLSDEFAVLDAVGMVHPFPTKLSVRVGEDERRSFGATELGGVDASSSVRLAGIVLVSYRPGAAWAPQEISRGRAVLGLLDNTVAALARHAEALSVFRETTDGRLLLAGERGDAEPVVADLLSRLNL